MKDIISEFQSCNHIKSMQTIYESVLIESKIKLFEDEIDNMMTNQSTSDAVDQMDQNFKQENITNPIQSEYDISESEFDDAINSLAKNISKSSNGSISTDEAKNKIKDFTNSIKSQEDLKGKIVDSEQKINTIEQSKFSVAMRRMFKILFKLLKFSFKSISFVLSHWKLMLILAVFVWLLPKTIMSFGLGGDTWLETIWNLVKWLINCIKTFFDGVVSAVKTAATAKDSVDSFVNSAPAAAMTGLMKLNPVLKTIDMINPNNDNNLKKQPLIDPLRALFF